MLPLSLFEEDQNIQKNIQILKSNAHLEEHIASEKKYKNLYKTVWDEKLFWMKSSGCSSGAGCWGCKIYYILRAVAYKFLKNERSPLKFLKKIVQLGTLKSPKVCV